VFLNKHKLKVLEGKLASDLKGVIFKISPGRRFHYERETYEGLGGYGN
jgi:hypothetical protein